MSSWNQNKGKGAVVVTGASSGIGSATVKQLLRSGFRVFGSVRHEDDAVRLTHELGQMFSPLLFDVRDEEAIQRAAAKVSAEISGQTLVGLVNNAGGAIAGPLLYQKMVDFRRQFEINVFGQFAVIQAFTPLLGSDKKRTGKPGRIVMISSTVGKFSLPFMAAYGASKHAIEGLSEGLRRELMLFGIDVIVIGPGPVSSAFDENMRKEDQGQFLETPYAEPMSKFQNMMTKMKMLPPERIAESIEHALTTSKPKVRYTVTANFVSDWLVPTRLTKRLVDMSFAKQLGLLN